MSARGFRRNRQRVAEREARRKRVRARKLTTAAGAAIGATVLFAPAADATTFTVTKLADTDDGTCDADCSLREAAEAANDDAAADADVITFASSVTGTIELGASLGHINLYGGTDGLGVTIQGPGASVLTVSGENDDRIFKTFGFDAPDTPVTISGLTLANGASDLYGGGAILNSTYAGLVPYAAALTVADSVLRNNTTGSGDSSRDGGAIKSLYGDLTITNTTITDNYGFDDGGGVFVDEGTLTVTGSTISNNTADSEGGGISVVDTPGGGTDVSISDSKITGNRSLDDEGGGIYLESLDGGAVIERTTLSGNEAYNEGGGVYFDYGSDDVPFTINSSTFSGNEAEEGAGVYIDETDDQVRIRNSTFSGNRALYQGGGIAVDGDPDTDEDIAIQNTTIAGNSTVGGDSDDAGGGLYLGAYYQGGTDYADDVALSSTIIADNSSVIGPDVALDPDTDTGGSLNTAFSLIENSSGASINATGPNVIGVDPQLGPLADNGGPTQTHAPSFGSPVIDKGVANGLGADQRGAQRTFDAANVANSAGGDGTDVGAVELLPGGRLSLAQCQGQTENVLFAPGSAIVGGDANDVIVGTSGNDSVDAGKGNDLICAGDGNDSVKGGGGKDREFGEAGKDKLGGNGGKDNVKGGGGKDNIKGGGGKDKLAGQAGADTIKGGGGADTLKGGGGKDKLIGGPGKDKLNGGGGKDSETQ